MKRSLEMVVAMLGILKAGGAYIPIDPRDPAERQSFELQYSGTTILVTTDELAKSSCVDCTKIVRIDADWPEIARHSQANPEAVVRLENLAYVLYTSGSTGRPKGVMVTHSGLVNYLSWAVTAYGKEAGRSALVHSSISFDLTITALYTPLLVGGQVELLPDDAGVEMLVDALRQPRIFGLVKITPTHLELLSHRLLSAETAGKIELLVIGGENLPAESLRYWREVFPTTRLINEYGPTETVVGCCVYEVVPSDPHIGSVPIGKAIDHTQLYVLDDLSMPVRTGVIGELYIGGAGVARGYLNQPELTRERFLPDLFSSEPGARLYKTGDMVRCRKDGTLEYVGRADYQVKIRGHRVELGEIEAVLFEHGAVRQAVATVREDVPGDRQLAGYVIKEEGHTVTPKELRHFLREKLPEYMVPVHLELLADFPLTPSGKVDRRALSTLKKHRLRQEFISPGNANESRLTTMWKEVLGISSIGVTDNFFDLGGDSLLMTKLLARIEQSNGKRFSMAAIFEAPTIRQMAVILDKDAPPSRGVIPVQPEGSLAPFFCIGAGPLFRPLALRLGLDRPFLSLMPSHLTELKQMSPPYRLEQIAAYLINSILEFQAEGPYHLGGWSASGIVAYETARQLMERGHEVALLVMFDTPNPTFQHDVLKEFWFDSRLKKIEFLVAKLFRIDRRTAPAYVAEKVKAVRQTIHAAFHGHSVPARLDEVVSKKSEQIVQLAVASYRPLPYFGRLAFFKAAERPLGEAWDFSCGWPAFINGRFEVYETPGDHESMFKEPNVEILAGNLTKILVSET